MKIETALRLKNNLKSSTKISVLDSNTVSFDDKKFNFNYVFDQNSTQNDVYDQVVDEYAKCFMRGENVTIFAYGPFESGKSYTMGSYLFSNASVDEQGIIPKVLIALFTLIANERLLNEQVKYEVSFSSFEIESGTKLQLMDEIEVNSLFGLGEFLKSPSLKVGSHFFFKIKVKKTISNEEKFDVSFNFIDLASSTHETFAFSHVKAKLDLIELQNFLKKNHQFNRENNLIKCFKECISDETKILFLACIDPADPCIVTINFASGFTLIDENNNNIKCTIKKNEGSEKVQNLEMNDDDFSKVIRTDVTPFRPPKNYKIRDSIELYFSKSKIPIVPKFKIPEVPAKVDRENCQKDKNQSPKLIKRKFENDEKIEESKKKFKATVQNFVKIFDDFSSQMHNILKSLPE